MKGMLSAASTACCVPRATCSTAGGSSPPPGVFSIWPACCWMQSYGAYAVLLADDFGWSKTVLAGAFA
jgi:hypothetical protein